MKVPKVMIVIMSAWLFIVTLAYFVTHEPFSLNNALAIGDVCANVVVLGILLVLAASIGRRLTRRFEFGSGLDALVFQGAVGLGTISSGTLVIGLVSVNRILFWAIVVAILILLRADVRATLADVRALRIQLGSRLEKLLFLFVVVMAGLTLLTALTPPMGWDAQIYHLTIGKTALEAGRIVAPHDRFTFSYPSFGEMLYLAAMTLKSDIVAQGLDWFFLIALGGAVFAFAARYFSPLAGWLASAILFAAPSVVINATSAYVDVPLAFFTFVAFYAFTLGREKDETRYFILAGVLAGCAAGFKYNALIIPLALAFVNFRLSRESFQRNLLFLGTSVVVVALWYVRNWIFMGNPIYPFVWGGPNWDSFRAEWLAQPWSGFISDSLKIILAPWYATILGREGALNFEATIGVFMLALIPLIGLIPRQAVTREPEDTARVIRDALIFCLPIYLFWLAEIAYSNQLLQTRFLFAIFPVLAIVAAYAFTRLAVLDIKSFSLYRFTSLLIVVVLGLTLFEQTLSLTRPNPLPYLIGDETRAEFVKRALIPPGYADALQSLGKLDATARVLILWDGRTYYAPIPQAQLQPDQMGDNFAHLVFLYNDVDTIATHLRAEGYAHILLSREDLAFVYANQTHPLESKDIEVLRDLLTLYFVRVDGSQDLGIVEQDGVWNIVNAEQDTYALYTWKEPR